MTDFDTAIDAILADPHALARQASRAIGYVGFDMPEDVLAAPGLTAVHLAWRPAEPSPRTREWIEPSFAPWTWAMIEDWAAGAYDFMDAVVFTRGDDTAQRLYYYVCELQRTGALKGPRPLIWDAAYVPRPSSARHSVAAVRKLAAALGLDDAALAGGIERADRRRAHVARLLADRRGGAAYERLARAALFAPIEDLPIPPADACTGPRILLAGSPPANDTLHRAVEAAGGTIVAEAHALSLARYGAPIGETDNPATAIAAHARSTPNAKRAFGSAGGALVEAARAAGCDAILLWLIEEEEALTWHVPAQMEALADAGLAALLLARRAWDASDGVADAIGAFVKGLNR